MALNPETVNFLLENILSTHFRQYGTVVKQLMGYLGNEVQDNPVYLRYEEDRDQWDEEDFVIDHRLNLPSNFEQAKSFAYALFKLFTQKEDDFPSRFSSFVFRQRHIPDGIDRLNDSIYGYFKMAIEDIVYANPALEIKTQRRNNFNKIFIIHGHDETLITEVKDLFHSVGLESVILREQIAQGKHILDLFIKEASEVGYAVALFTPDDITLDGKSRARQNVILELGYFLGVLGKDRVRMIVKPNLTIPSDMAGVLYEQYDTDGNWKQKLLREIVAVGISIKN